MTRHTRNRQVMKATGDKFFMLCRNREIKNVIATCIYIDKTFNWMRIETYPNVFYNYMTYIKSGFKIIRIVKGRR